MKTPIFTAFAMLGLLVGSCGGSTTSSGSGGAPGGGGSGGSAATGGSGGSAGTAGTDGGVAGSGGAPGCSSGGVSNLSGVSITFPDQPCVFSLAQAAAGIEITYQVVVSHDLAGVIPQGQSSCPEPGPSGLYVFEQLSGGGQSYCLCDTGLCPAPPATPVTIAQGTTNGTFSWDGRNWSGPSDTGNPKGPPFPAGSYTLEARAVGTQGGAPYTVSGTFVITLTP